MLFFFPEPYPDEAIYSVFERYHKWSGNPIYRYSHAELFGSGNIETRNDFPCYLDFLCDQLSNKSYTPEYFINEHTIFPFFKPFLPKERQLRIIQDMKACKSDSVEIKLGIKSMICRNKGLKICVKCIKEDKTQYGEAYLHRTHQIPGNYICLKHNQLLQEYILPYDLSDSRFFGIDDCQINISTFDYNDNLLLEFENLSKDIEFIVRNNFDLYDRQTFHRKYTVMLHKKGFKTVGGPIKQRELTNGILNRYSKEFLIKLESYIDETNFDSFCNWIRTMMVKPESVIHPIRHLLFIRFLFGSMKEFYDFDEEYLPFGKGPWPCLNPVAEHYEQNIITDCEIKRNGSTGQPLGTFCCSCGFVYTRNEIEKNEDDRYKASKIKQYGHIWEDLLKKYITERRYSINALSKMMYCSRYTIVDYAHKFGLIQYLNTIQPNRHAKEEGKVRYHNRIEEAHMKTLIKILAENPTLTRTQIVKKIPNTYRWLTKHKRDWYETVVPKVVKNRDTYIKNASTVNWSLRDQELSQKIIDAINEIMLEDKPRYISIGLLAKKIGYPRLYQDLSKLPKVKAALERNIESLEDFQIRYINYIVEQEIKCGNKLLQGVIFKRANLYGKKVSDRVKNHFREIIENNMFEK